MGRKTAIVVVAVLELAIIGSLVAWRVADWHAVGWSGFAYHPDREAKEYTQYLPGLGTSGQVFMVTPGSPADRAGFAAEDRVAAVNGVPITDTEGLAKIDDELVSGDPVRFTIDRDDRQLDLELTLESPLRSGFQLSALVANIVAGLIWLGISLLVYWSRPDSRVAGVFFALCASGAAVYLFFAGGELDYPGLRGILPFGDDLGVFTFLGLTAVASIAMTNLVLHLALVFPKPRPITTTWPQIFLWIHLLPYSALLTLLICTGFMFATKRPPVLVVGELAAAAAAAVVAVSVIRSVSHDGWLHTLRTRPWMVLAVFVLATSQLLMALRLTPDPLLAVFFGFFVLGATIWIVICLTAYAVFTAIALYRSYRESGLELRQQVRWPLWGTITSMVLSVVISTVAVVYSLFETDIIGRVYVFQAASTLATKLVYLLIPVSFAFAILKHRLLDIDVIIRKTVVYTAVTGFVIAVYLALAGVSGLALVQSIGLESQVATIAATLAVVAFFVPVRNRVQRFVDRRFFQRERDLERAAADVAGLVLHSADPAQTLTHIADSVQRALRTSGMAFLARRPGSDRMVVQAQLGLGEARLAGLSVSRLDPVLADGTVLDAKSLAGDIGALARAARSHVLAVARRDGKPVGLLAIGRPQGRAEYDDDERRFLAAVAEQVAVAVGRSMQHLAEGEFEKARKIQRSLLPESLPEVAGLSVAARWEPAREVSGDYYDVIRLDDHRLLVCIGDVVGKGLPAALLMSTLQAAVKAVAATTDSPSRLCEQVRTVVRGSLSGGTFVTFFCAVVDRETMTVTSTNAGHNPPILVRPAGDVVRLEHGGPAMARLLTAGYGQGENRLGLGDRLVLFTDGATEAMNPAGEMFGDGPFEALATELVSSTVAEAERGLAATVVAHARGVLQDDLTLIVVGVDE